ncbi:MAG: hypothetical protein AB2421_08000 [Thermotaleaceae bacterium]
MIAHVLNYSLEKHMPIHIIYQKGLEISQRQIQVKSIDGDVVQAYCLTRKAARNFKKENILSAMIPGMGYSSVSEKPI